MKDQSFRAAFPFGQISELTGLPINGCFDPGMSLREYFAVHAPASEIEQMFPATVGDAAGFLGIEASEYKNEIHYMQIVCLLRKKWANEMLKALAT